MSSVLASHPDDGDNVSTDGTLFRGIRFWIAQRLPMRSSFVDKVKMNGGLMVGLEKSADILIVDHLRKDNPPDSFSYRWIEQSIKNGVLEDKEDHRAEPTQGYVRPVGSWKPAKSSRNPYTAGDDRILYDWVTDQEKKGGKVLGNEIYKQLEQQNSRHPWQSWRDRWVKYVSHKAPLSSAAARSTPPLSIARDDNTSLEIAVEYRTERNSSTMPLIVHRKRATIRSEPNFANQAENIDGDSTESEAESLPQKARTRRKHNLDITPKAQIANNPTVRPEPISPIRAPTKSHKSDAITTTEHVLIPSAEGVDSEERQQWSGRQRTRFYALEPSEREAILRMDRSRFPKPFTAEERHMLFDVHMEIEQCPVSSYDKLWLNLAGAHPHHTWIEWKEFYEAEILPIVEDSIAEAQSENVPMLTEVPNDSAIGDHSVLQSPTIVSEIEANADSGKSPAVQIQLLPQASNPNQRPFPSLKINATSSKQTLHGVVIPSPSSRPEIDHTAVQSFKSIKEENESPKRKRGRPRKVHSDSPGLTKKRRLDTSITRSQVASNALSNAIATPRPPLPDHNIEVITIIDSDEGEAEQEQHTTERITNKVAVDNSSKEKGFDLYKSHGIPEGEEENAVFNENGLPSFPRHYTKVRSEPTLDAFGDPPKKNFKLARNHSSDPGVWHDISMLEVEDVDLVDNGDGFGQVEADFMEATDSQAIFDTSGELPIDQFHIVADEDEDDDEEHANDQDEDQGEDQDEDEDEDQDEDEDEDEDGNEDKNEHGDVDSYEDDIDVVRGKASLQPPFAHEEQQNILNYGQAATTREVEDVISQGEFAGSSPLPVQAYSGTNLDVVLPDTPSNQLRAEMRETTLRYSSDEDDEVEARDSISSPIHNLQRIHSTLVDTQAVVDFDAIEDDYLDVPPPDDFENGDDEKDIVHLSPAGLDWDEGRYHQDESEEVHDDADLLSARFVDPGTQAIVEANTQPLLLDDYPQTYDRDNDSDIPSSPPMLPPPVPQMQPREQRSNSSGQSVASGTYDGMDPINAFRARQLALGSSDDDINAALLCTTLNSRSATLVLESLRRGKGFPVDMPGVWSEEEDDVISSGNAAAMRRLERKHGGKAFQQRVEFLELQRSV